MQLHATEKARQMAQDVKAALAEMYQSRGLTSVTRPNQEGSHKSYSCKGDLEQACIDEAGQCFMQAQDTTLLSAPLVNIFGETGIGSQSFKQVLDGTFTPPMACDPFATKLLHHLYNPPPIKDIPPCTVKDYQCRWCKAQETTSSSPSEIHFGHYITSTFNLEILVINTKLADIPLCTGLTPACWHKGLNVMLKKSPGNYNVKKLHIILLFEADFNCNNKWLGKAIMFNAEAVGVLADKQYGSQKQKSTIVQCLNKMLFYDIVWFWHQPAALCLNNAKSCYDHIILLIAALCLCCLGTSKQSVSAWYQ